MAGTDVGELVISLAFESGDAKAEMKALVREVGNIDNSFRALAAEAGHFGQGLDGARNQAKSLSAQLEMQNRVVQQTGKDLGAANQRLADAQKRQSEYKAKVDATTAAHDQLAGELKEAKAQWAAAKKAMGENSEEANTLGLNVLELEDAYKKSGEELKKLNGQYKRSGTDVKKAALDLQQYAGQEDEAKVKAGALRQELERVNRTVALQSGLLNATALKTYGEALDKTAAKQIALGRSLMMGVTAPILGGAAYAAKQAISWESSFAGVEKTVDGTTEQLAEIERGLISMSEALPATKNELAAIAADAGQLGIQTPNVLSFTRTMADLKESTNLGDEGASQMAKFANITQMAQTDFDRAGSAIVELGNNMATTERDIMAMGMRLAGAGKQIGLSQPAIFGFAAALSSLGIEAEAGGSSFSKLMVEMQLAVETGSADLKDYARIAGMTGKEFQTAFKEDAAGAIASFIAGLGSGGDSAIKILDDIGISEVRMRDSLLRASNATGIFSGAIGMSNKAWSENTALANEASKRYSIFESRLKMAGNKAANAAMTFGQDLMPALEGGLSVVTDLTEGFSSLNEQTRGAAMSAALAAAGIGPLVTIIGKGNQAVANTAKGLAAFKTALVDAGGGAKGLLSATSGLLGPVGIAAAGAAALYAGYKLYDYASGAKAARDALKELQAQAEEWKNSQAKTIYDTGNDAFARFGLEKADFGGAIDASKDWMKSLMETWTDGKVETNEIVRGYVGAFKDGSDKVREAILARQEIQKELGASDPQNAESLKQLEAYDQEVERLLKKRQNGKLSEEDQGRLNEIIQLRAQIQLQYVTGEGGGYDSIQRGVEAEKARIEAEGETVTVDLYADALRAGAQGHKAQVDALNQSYHEQYAAVAAISDETEREAALTELNTRHQEALNAARAEYKALVSKYGVEAFESEGVQKAKEDMQAFVETIKLYNEGKIDETGLKEFTDALDEGQLASYVALLTQLKESGLGGADLGGGLTADQLLGGYSSVTEFLKAHKGEGFDALGELLGAAGDEAMRVLVDLGLSPEGQTLADKLEDWKTNGITIDATVPVTLTDLPETLTIDATSPVSLTGVPEALTISAEAPVTVTGLPDGPLTIPANTPVTLTDLPDGITVQADAPVTMTGVPDSLTVQAYAPLTLVDVPDSVVIPEAVIQSVRYAGTSESVDLAGSDLKAPFGAANLGTSIENRMRQTVWEAKDMRENPGNSRVDIGATAASLEALELIGGVEKLKEFIAAYNAALESGQPISEEAAAQMQSVLEFAQALQELQITPATNILEDLGLSLDVDVDGIVSALQSLVDKTTTLGDDAGAGIGKGMSSHDFAPDAAATAANAETALRGGGAFNSASPAKRMIPLGLDTAAGVGAGMRAYNFVPDATGAALGASTALDAALKAADLAGTGETYGRQLMQGIDDGLRGMRGAVVGTAEAIANEIKGAIRKAWDINSPSREGEWLSSMLMKGIEIPIARELPNIIGMLDALELRTARARTNNITGAPSITNHNERTGTVTVNLNGGVHASNERDVWGLLEEIADAGDRVNRGMGG